MEFLSSSQLQKYESIIDQIKTEFEVHEELKRKVEEEDNKIVLSHLANTKISEKVCHVGVKIFNDLIDLFNIYAGELQSDFHKFGKFNNCKFYLLEIYMSQPLTQKVKNLNWMLHTCVKTETVCINKTLNLSHKFPILEIIPVDQNVINCKIKTSLVLPSNNKWTVIKLNTVHVDISYHFQTYKEKRKSDNKYRNILQVTKCYNETVNTQELRKPIMLEYKLHCDVEKSNFIQTILRNSYHKLDIELFSHFENENDFVLQFSNGLEKHTLVYNKHNKILTLKGGVDDLCLLKKYFCKQFHCPKSPNAGSTINIKLKENISQNSQEATKFYNEFRKSLLKLPI